MTFFTRPNLSDIQFRQKVDSILTLEGETNFLGTLKSKNTEIDAEVDETINPLSLLYFNGEKIILNNFDEILSQFYSDLGEITTPKNNDEFIIKDSSNGDIKKIKYQTLYDLIRPVYLKVDTVGSIITLPENPNNELVVVVFDNTGEASNHPIKIQTTDGNYIQGTTETEAYINSDYGSITFYYNGMNWSIIGFVI